MSDDIKKPWQKSTQKEIKNLINNQNVLVEYPNKGKRVTPCMDVYKTEIQNDGSLAKLKLGILVRGYVQNKELVGDTWSPTASIRTLKYFLADAAKHKAIVHQIDFIGSFLQAKGKNGILMKLDSRYTYYFGRSLILLKSIYVMTNSGKLFYSELTE